MRKLILIKHAMPNIDEGLPSKQWSLSEDGKVKSKSLSNHIKEYSVRHIYTSDEQKAIETGNIISKELKMDLKIHKSLHENDRTGLNYLMHDELRIALYAEKDLEVLKSWIKLAARCQSIEEFVTKANLTK